MDAGDSYYSYSLTTFSPSGKLGQIEHAMHAVNNGATSLAIKATNGLVLCTDKKTQSILMDPGSFHRVHVVDDHCGLTYSGMGPDSRVLLGLARKAASRYKLTYDQPIPIRILARELANSAQEYTQMGGVRPFGASVLLGGKDQYGYHLYQVDPSGIYYAWKAAAMGRNYINARTFLEKRYTADMDCEDAIHTALLTLKEGFDGKMTSQNVELGVCGADGRFRVLTPSEVKDYLEEVL
eukprot:NODE_2661_length_1067_cov_29.344794_g2218_i0.p1 GENE.NODE_2661_length_1067_cov_29.344794_g2218_i0~~NODE_2661_length_1067_cov_29.344794_g2218_i0.p1  ORF type:complete len:238 (+),score=50.63 NODE_2661_length_1067_cov_29.344794_g2218_i0:286-999(+)